MKKFVGISSILLLSSVLANTGVSLASAAETTEEAKMVDTTKEKNEKKSSSDDASDSSTKEKNARDIASTSTEESSAIEDVDGTAMLQDPAKDLLDKITESTKEEDSEEKASKEDKEKGNKKSEKAKENLKKLTEENLMMRSSRAYPLADWNYESKSIDGRAVVVLTSLKSNHSTTVTVPSSYYAESSWGGTQIKPCYISKDAFRGNNRIQSIIFEKRYEGDYHSRIYDPKTKSSTTDASGMFSNMSNLNSVDFKGVDLSNIRNFSSMFSGDINLATIQNISNLDTSNGENFSHMFAGCTKLKEVDFSNNSFRSAKDFSYMFYNCLNLKEIHLKNLPNHVDMTSMCQNTAVIYAELMFQRASYLAKSTYNIFMLDQKYEMLPLLIHSNSQSFLTTEEKSDDLQLYTYARFAGDGRVLPFILVSGDGLFENTEGLCTKFDVGQKPFKNEKITMIDGITNGYATKKDPIRQLEYPQSSINEIIKTVNPFPTFEKKGSMNPAYEKDNSRCYAGYYKDETEYRYGEWKKVFLDAPNYLKAIFTKLTAQYSPVNPEMAKGHTVDSKNPISQEWPENRMPQGPLGFAYQPSTLTTNDMELDGKEKHTSLTSDGQQKFHLGVRDYTKTPSPWTVSARLTWDDKQMNQTTIKASGGGIKLNMNSLNNTTNQPKLFKDSQLNNYEKTDVQSLILSGMTLGNGRTIQVMKSNGRQGQAFYDLTLGNLTLNVPDDSKLQPKSYQGQIDWNLTTGPNGN